MGHSFLSASGGIAGYRYSGATLVFRAARGAAYATDSVGSDGSAEPGSPDDSVGWSGHGPGGTGLAL